MRTIGIMCISICLQITSVAQSGIIKISGHYPAFAGDTLELRSWSGLPYSQAMREAYFRDKTLINENEHFSFCIQADGPVYIQLDHYLKKGGTRPVLSGFIAEPGDDIHIEAANDTTNIRYGAGLASFRQELAFTGKGAQRYTCMDNIRREEKEPDDNLPHIPPAYANTPNMRSISWVYQRVRALSDRQLRCLRQWQDSLSVTSFELIRLDVIASGMNRIYRYLRTRQKILAESNAAEHEMFESFYKECMLPMDTGLPYNLKAFSAIYPSAVIQRLRLEDEYYKREVSIPEYILKTYTGQLKERLLMEYFIENYDRLPSGESPAAYLGAIQNSLYRSLLKTAVGHQSPGAPVRDFALPDTRGNIVRLSDFRGKVVFVDFWFTGCTGCYAYYKNILSAVEDSLAGCSDVVFITISIDADREQWLKSVASGKYTSDHAVNLYTAGKGSRHPIISELNVKSYPRPIIIGRDGSILSNNSEALRSSKDRLITIIRKATGS